MVFAIYHELWPGALSNQAFYSQWAGNLIAAKWIWTETLHLSHRMKAVKMNL
jgi:hypothetical protein